MKKLIKDKIIGEIIKREGGYVHNPKDKGGRTKYGITQATAHRAGWVGSVRNLPLSLAFDIYSSMYWDVNRIDDIISFSPKVGEKIADIGVNMGTKRAAYFLQRCLNVLNREEKFYKNVTIDGIIGDKSIEALNTFFEKRGEAGEVVIFKMLQSLQGERYVHLAESRAENEEFIFGWFLNRV